MKSKLPSFDSILTSLHNENPNISLACDPFSKFPFPSFSYLAPKPYISTEEVNKAYWSQSKKFSEIALEYYNKKHGAHYELVEVLDSSPFLCDEVWIHCNFKAKDIAIPGEGSEGSSIKLFFSEIKAVPPNPEKFRVLSCSILDGVKQRLGCARCNEHIIHPNAGFRKGVYGRNENRVRSLRPRPSKRSRYF